MSRPAAMHIDSDALLSNFNRVRQLAPQSKILAMIKANAYGHGAVRCAKTLEDADAFGVASLDEARILRSSGITNKIVLMAGFFDAAELSEIIRLDCDLVVHDKWQILALENASISKPLSVWLKIDLGMHRLGIAPNDLVECFQRLSVCKNVLKPLKLMTHFPSADKDRDITNIQTKDFLDLTKGMEVEKSLANSAAILQFPEAHAEWVRPGLMLYGVSPIAEKLGYDFDLQPVMSMTSQLMSVKWCQTGEKIGYGGRYQCSENMPIGIVAFGYADGYPYHALDGTPFLINGAICPLVGNVAMDMMCVDLRSCPSAKAGDQVLLWGNELPIEYVARKASTIPYEIMTHVNPRVHGYEFSVSEF